MRRATRPPAASPRSSRFAPSRFALGATFLLAVACSGDPAEWALQAASPAQAVRGELVRYVAYYDEARGSAGPAEHYTVRPLGTQDEVPVEFVSPPDVSAGALIDVWGERKVGTIVVDRFQVVEDPRAIESVQQPVIGGPPYRARSFAFVLVDISNGAVPVGLSPEEAAERLFGITADMAPSVRQYFIEASYGRQEVTGQVFGPVSFAMTGCNTGALTQSLTPLIDGNYDHYLWYIHPRNPSCGWTGLAQGGRPDRPSKHTWYNAASGCVVLVQEPGHNLGMNHSSAMKCPSSAFVDEPSTICSHQEYGDRYDPMGNGCGHMNTFQKAYQGWFDSCNLVEVTGSRTFTLLPLEVACNGVQALQVPMPRSRVFSHAGGLTELTHYYIELRAPLGIDEKLTPQPVVQVRVSNDTRSRTQRGVHTWLLDMNPGTGALDGLGAGESFTDPTGSPRIIIESMGPHSATVRVEIDGVDEGAAICLDGSELPGSGPGPESCAAGPSAPDGTPPPVPVSVRRTIAPMVEGAGCTTCKVGGPGGRAGGGAVLLPLLIYLIASLGRARALRPKRSASCAR
jgi:hypothetical protein